MSSYSDWIQGMLTHCLCTLSKEDDLDSAIEKVRKQEKINIKLKYSDLHKYDHICSFEFDTEFEDGDEIWAFNNGRDAFRSLCGSGGYALVRNGKVIDADEVICS